MTIFSVNISDSYVTPEGELTPAQYVTFVMNNAARSYAGQYREIGGPELTLDEGIEAACDAYNAALPEPAPEPEVPE